MDESAIKLKLTVSLGRGVPDDEVDLVTRDLRSQLLDAGMKRVDLATAALPANAKAGTGSVVGDLMLAVLPVLLPKLVELIKSWRAEAPKRSVTVRAEVNGAPVEIILDGSDASAEAAGRLLAQLTNASRTSAISPPST
jgi:hypothetical protein